jgi:hypothetical protein
MIDRINLKKTSKNNLGILNKKEKINLIKSNLKPEELNRLKHIIQIKECSSVEQLDIKKSDKTYLTEYIDIYSVKYMWILTLIGVPFFLLKSKK